MSSSAYKKALEAAGYLSTSGRAAPGFVAAEDETSAKLKRIFADDRIGLKADAVFTAQLRGRLESDVPPYLNERRQLRIYGSDDLFILKPSEIRYWDATAGLNDADMILGDHWLRRRDAVAHA